MLYFALNNYTWELRVVRNMDNVPKNVELAKLLGITPTAFGRLAQNKQEGPSRLQISIIIGEFRRRGFDTTPNDLLRWIENEDEKLLQQ